MPIAMEAFLGVDHCKGWMRDVANALMDTQVHGNHHGPAVVCIPFNYEHGLMPST
jgi:hypothetical protein